MPTQFAAYLRVYEPLTAFAPDRQRFWRHSMRTAGYARLLAKLLQGDADSAYLAGLMLRTGHLMMAMS